MNSKAPQVKREIMTFPFYETQPRYRLDGDLVSNRCAYLILKNHFENTEEMMFPYLQKIKEAQDKLKEPEEEKSDQTIGNDNPVFDEFCAKKRINIQRYKFWEYIQNVKTAVTEQNIEHHWQVFAANAMQELREEDNG